MVSAVLLKFWFWEFLRKNCHTGKWVLKNSTPFKHITFFVDCLSWLVDWVNWSLIRTALEASLVKKKKKRERKKRKSETLVAMLWQFFCWVLEMKFIPIYVAFLTLFVSNNDADFFFSPSLQFCAKFDTVVTISM